MKHLKFFVGSLFLLSTIIACTPNSIEEDLSSTSENLSPNIDPSLDDDGDGDQSDQDSDRGDD